MEDRRDDKKESMKLDFMLTGLYFVVSGLLYVCCYSHNDFVIMWAVPGLLVLAVSSIFISYLRKILSAPKERNDEA